MNKPRLDPTDASRQPYHNQQPYGADDDYPDDGSATSSNTSVAMGSTLPEDYASEDNDPRVKAASKAIRKALETLRSVALERGCKNPAIFLEDSSGIYVVDADHPSWVKQEGFGGGIAATVVLTRDVWPDCGVGTGGW